MNKKPVEICYIGPRKSWTDNIYGSGLIFEPGKSYIVEGNLAEKLLRHNDCFCTKGNYANVIMKDGERRAGVDRRVSTSDRRISDTDLRKLVIAPVDPVDTLKKLDDTVSHELSEDSAEQSEPKVDPEKVKDFTEDSKDEDTVRDIKLQIESMNKANLVKWVAANYAGMELDRTKATVDLKKEACNIVDLFGLPASAV